MEGFRPGVKADLTQVSERLRTFYTRIHNRFRLIGWDECGLTPLDEMFTLDGDAAHADGYVWLAGRKKDLIIRGAQHKARSCYEGNQEIRWQKLSAATKPHFTGAYHAPAIVANPTVRQHLSCRFVDNRHYPSFIDHRCGVPERSDPDSARRSVRGGADTAAAEVDPIPTWFTQFLNDRQTRKPSAHTMKAYRQDFTSIATLITGDPARLGVADITKDTMRTAFAAYARNHEAASIRRCWSTWNVLCTFLYTGEMLAANPMQLVGRPKLAKPLPKALPRTAVEALLETVAHDQDSKRQIDWAERDLAIIHTTLLAGLRAEELRQADVGDIRTKDDGSAVIHVKGKGGKDRSVPIEAELLSVIEAYLAAARSGSTVIQSAKRTAGAPPYRDGRPKLRCSLAATANASPVEHCNRESNGPSNAPDPKRSPFPAL